MTLIKLPAAMFTSSEAYSQEHEVCNYW